MNRNIKLYIIVVQGWTALHLASDNGLTEVVTVLLDHAADPNVKTADVSIFI